jgi:hypothetical protein
MIELPRRSVTRFFIPLIDVLTLLFCIFLLMPVVKRTGEGDDPVPGTGGTTGTEPRPTNPDLKGLSPEDLARLVAEERRELERIRKEKAEALQQRLLIRVLEIDGANGRLYAHDPDRVEIDGPVRAQGLIDRDKRQAGSKELYYLILFPRKVTGYPEEGQVKQYDRWFQGVAHSFDNPRAGGEP